MNITSRIRSIREALGLSTKIDRVQQPEVIVRQLRERLEGNIDGAIGELDIRSLLYNSYQRDYPVVFFCPSSVKHVSVIRPGKFMRQADIREVDVVQTGMHGMIKDSYCSIHMDRLMFYVKNDQLHLFTQRGSTLIMMAPQ